jgi:hypothetical protein
LSREARLFFLLLFAAFCIGMFVQWCLDHLSLGVH